MCQHCKTQIGHIGFSGNADVNTSNYCGFNNRTNKHCFHIYDSTGERCCWCGLFKQVYHGSFKD